MLLSPDEHTILVIDGYNLYTASRYLGFDVDYRLLLEFVRDQTALIRATYYTVIVEPDATAEKPAYTPLKPLSDWLAYNGYVVVAKPGKELVENGRRRGVKGNMHVEMVIDTLSLAHTGRIDHVLLFAGDGELCPLIQAVQAQGVKVTLISSLKASLVADELRRQADQFVELASIGDDIARRQLEPRPPQAA